VHLSRTRHSWCSKLAPASSDKLYFPTEYDAQVEVTDEELSPLCTSQQEEGIVAGPLAMPWGALKTILIALMLSW
jgi:hypothetical protein